MRNLLLLALAGALLSGCGTKEKTPPAVQLDTALTVRYFGRDGKSVLELLEASHQVEKKTYSVGSFVEAIDSIPNRRERFWLYYVNGKKPGLASDRYKTNSGDTIEWRFEAKYEEVK